MQILRHADFSITMEVYSQVTSEATRDALKKARRKSRRVLAAAGTPATRTLIRKRVLTVPIEQEPVRPRARFRRSSQAGGLSAHTRCMSELRTGSVSHRAGWD